MIAGIASGSPILAVCDTDSPLGCEIRNNNLGPCLGWKTVQEVPILLRELSQKRDSIVKWQQETVKRASFYERGKIIDAFDTAIMSIVKKTSTSK